MNPDLVTPQSTAVPESDRDELIPAAELWQIASTQLRAELSEGNFSAWFDRSTPLGFDGQTFLLSVALVVDESLAPEGEEPTAPTSPGDLPEPRRDPGATAFHPKYTFASFVI